MKKESATDLQKFIKIFQADKYKSLPTGIEVRGAADLELAVQSAQRVIDKNRLNLSVKNTADMAAYKAFEIVCL